jgi:hypothetical protein
VPLLEPCVPYRSDGGRAVRNVERLREAIRSAHRSARPTSTACAGHFGSSNCSASPVRYAAQF